MRVRPYLCKNIAGALGATVFFFSACVPLAASASSVLDIANAIKALPPSSQTTLCAADAADCATFLSNPTLSTLANLNSTTLSTILNNSSVSYLVPTLDTSILSTLSTSGTLNDTLSGLTSTVLQTFTAPSFSSLTTTAISSMLGGTDALNPSILGSLSTSLLTGFSGSDITSILGSSLLSATDLQNLPSTLFNQLGSTQLSSILTMDPSSILSNLSGSLLTGFDTSGVISDAFNSLASSPGGSTIIGLLPGSLLGSITDTTMIAGILDGFSQTSLNALTDTFFSSFSTETMTGLLSSMSTDLMNQLGGELLSGFESLDLASIFNGMDLSALGDLGSIFTSLDLSTFSDLLGTDTIAGFLSGDVIGSITSMFSGVEGGIISGALDALGAGGLTALGGDVVGSLMGSVSGPVMDAVMGAVGGDVMSTITSLTGISIPGLGGFGLFVPVNDKSLNSAFKSYSSAFNKYASNMDQILKSSPDSLRNIITGANPQGEAIKECEEGDAEDLAFAYTNPPEPWAKAAASSTQYGFAQLPLAIPGEGEYVQVNKSGSLRCLLQEIIGYQKISLFTQIHGLLKQYISDAQQQQLSNKLLNKINAANLSWAKEGEQVTQSATGVRTTEAVYVENSDQSQFARNTRTSETIIAQAAAQDGDPVGSLNLCNPLETATAVAINVRDDTEDARNYIPEVTRCTTSAGSVSAYMDNANAEISDMDGAFFELGDMMRNLQDSPLGAQAIVRAETDRRLEQDRQRYAEARANSGFQPTIKCSGATGDPYCDPAFTTETTSGAQNQETVVSAVESGKDQIAGSETLDSTSANAAENISTEANTTEGGVAGYSSAALASSTAPVNALIHELYDTIQIGYFDLNKNQEDWASAALLNIYDMMKFNDKLPEVAIDRGSGTSETSDTDSDSAAVYVDF